MIGAGSLKGKKTYIVAAVTIIGAVAGYLTGDVDGTQLFQLVSQAIMAAAVRNGISGAGN